VSLALDGTVIVKVISTVIPKKRRTSRGRIYRAVFAAQRGYNSGTASLHSRNRVAIRVLFPRKTPTHCPVSLWHSAHWAWRYRVRGSYVTWQLMNATAQIPAITSSQCCGCDVSALARSTTNRGNGAAGPYSAKHINLQSNWLQSSLYLIRVLLSTNYTHLYWLPAWVILLIELCAVYFSTIFYNAVLILRTVTLYRWNDVHWKWTYFINFW